MQWSEKDAGRKVRCVEQAGKLKEESARELEQGSIASKWVGGSSVRDEGRDIRDLGNG